MNSKVVGKGVRKDVLVDLLLDIIEMASHPFFHALLSISNVEFLANLACYLVDNAFCSTFAIIGAKTIGGFGGSIAVAVSV